MHIPLATETPTTTGRGGGGILVISAIVAALGSLLFGFDTAVISGTTEALRQVFTLNDFYLGLTVSSALLGTMVGSLLVGRPADWWGRRPVLAALAGLPGVNLFLALSARFVPSMAGVHFWTMGRFTC